MIKSISYLFCLFLICSCNKKNIPQGYYRNNGNVYYFDTSKLIFKYYSTNSLSGIGYSKGNYKVIGDTIFFFNKKENDFIDIKMIEMKKMSDSIFISFDNFNNKFNHFLFINNNWEILTGNTLLISNIQNFDINALAIKIEIPTIKNFNSCANKTNFITSKITLKESQNRGKINISLDYNFFIYETLSQNIIFKKRKLKYFGSNKYFLKYNPEIDSSYNFSNFNFCGY